MARRNRRRSSTRAAKGGFFRKFFLILLCCIIVGSAVSAYILFETEKPSLSMDQHLEYLGTNVEFTLHVTDGKSGVRSVEVLLEQNGKNSQLFNRSFQRQAWFKDAGPKEITETLVVDAKKARLAEGQAALIIKVRDFSLNGMFSGNETVHTIPVMIDTKPPKVVVTHSQRYIRPGGSGIVTYQLTEPAARHGVQLDDSFFQGFPLDQSGKQFIAYIALPWDSNKPGRSEVLAVDRAGNQGASPIAVTFKPVQEKTDKINVSQGFLQKKTPEFEAHYPQMSGQLIEKYLFVNNEVRRQNAATIAELCASPSLERMWQGRFLRMPGAKRAGFADQRTYYFDGRAIDSQTHLGIDIASTAQADVRAANKGKVVYADYLGIYGNMVLIDHGQGIFSLYSHLSRIDTEQGAIVETDQHIGHTGTSGMAGGDHLHFSMLVHGIFVNPIEWWDQHWIDVNIESFISGQQS